MPTPHTAACEEMIALLNPPRIYLQHVEDLDRLRELFAIDQAAYNECSLEFATFRHWWERYDLGSRVLLSDNEIVAGLGIYPLATEQAIAFEQGRICEGDLLPVPIAECEAQPVHDWYISGIVVVNSLRGAGSPLRRLLRLGLSSWIDSGHVAYPLNLQAIAYSEAGRRLLELLGFAKIRVATELPDHCDLYKLRLESSHILGAT